jgi:hypothetical protein
MVPAIHYQHSFSALRSNALRQHASGKPGAYD